MNTSRKTLGGMQPTIEVVEPEKAVVITALFGHRKVRAAKARGKHVGFAA